MKKTIILAVIIIAVIVAGSLGYVVGYSRGGKAVTASYVPKIAVVNNLFPLQQGHIFSLTGSVKSISGNIVTINAVAVAQNPFTAKDFPLVRDVTVTDATVITLSQQKDSATYQKETTAFQKLTLQSTKGSSVPVGNAIIPPSPFAETTISVSDIKVGDTITVTSASDISTSTNFSATKIEVTHMMS